VQGGLDDRPALADAAPPPVAGSGDDRAGPVLLRRDLDRHDRARRHGTRLADDDRTRLPDGTFVLTSQLHWVTGWDADAEEYRATLNDNDGHADVMRGRIQGNRLVYESVGGDPVRLRTTCDISDPGSAVWTNESSVAGGPWTLVESYRMTPTRAMTAAAGG
jgi:hypothetical protein